VGWRGKGEAWRGELWDRGGRVLPLHCTALHCFQRLSALTFNARCESRERVSWQRGRGERSLAALRVGGTKAGFQRARIGKPSRRELEKAAYTLIVS